MWKHKESKWLVRGGRKVRCYLCGKKILAKGDLFLFHGDTGYYSHQSCMTESTTISGNERRKAVKKIAVGAAVVGAIAAGAGKFLDVSSQSKNSPASQTILTSQGLIPPALTSDPANPVPGQMWYRSDAGVEAHFDGVQNRVVYSSEINDGNVHVTSKGIINGLSVLPNDGTGWFGPDTTKGATAPGQYGSPYTKTFGIKESHAYLENNGGGTLALSPGTFILNDTISYISANPIRIIGESPGQYNENTQGDPVYGTVICPGSNFPYGTAGNQMGVTTSCMFNYDSDTLNSGLVEVENILFTTVPGNSSANQNYGVFQFGYSTGNGPVRKVLNTLKFTYVGRAIYSNTVGGPAYASAIHLSEISTPSYRYPIEIYDDWTIQMEAFSTGNNAIIGMGTNPSINLSYLKLYSSLLDIAQPYAPAIAVFGSAQVINLVSLQVFNGDGIIQIQENLSTSATPGNVVIDASDITWSLYGSPQTAYAMVNLNADANYIAVRFSGINAVNIGGNGDYGTTEQPAYVVYAYDTITLTEDSYIIVRSSAAKQATVSLEPIGLASGVTLPSNLYLDFDIDGMVKDVTTPSVPTSATAQENTNPYAVDVYVYGGAVTEIQITKDGTAYTVFSVSTAIAMSGQHFPLNNTDSITITYSTAPTWEWLSG